MKCSNWQTFAAFINMGAQIILRHSIKFNEGASYNIIGLPKCKIDKVRCLILTIRSIAWPKFPMDISHPYPIIFHSEHGHSDSMSNKIKLSLRHL